MWNLKLLAVTGIATATLVAGSAWYVYNSGKRSGISEMQTLWDAERLATQKAQVEEIEKARAKEQALQTTINRLQEVNREANQTIANLERDLVDSLRDRPDARAGVGGVPEGADAGTAGCTGAGLAGPDARFLAGFAADAARLQSALNACRAHAAEVAQALGYPIGGVVKTEPGANLADPPRHQGD